MDRFDLKPFDKVLVRNGAGLWFPALYGMKGKYKYLTSDGWCDECIPYEGNEEYLGTQNPYKKKDNVEEFISDESKDIRKWCIAHFKNCIAAAKDNEAYKKFLSNEVVGWLEKQIGRIDVDTILKNVAVKPAYKDGNAWCILLGDNIQEGICGFGDTKEEAFTEFLKALLVKKTPEEVGQIKTSSTEPIFKKGDWLVENEPNNYARFIQILDYSNIKGYRVSRDIHYDEDNVKSSFLEKYYHPFTIRDAKAGDVLFTPNGAGEYYVFVFKKIQKGTVSAFVACYHYVEGTDKVETEEQLDYLGAVDDSFGYFPATTEQKATLFNALAEKGYNWDSSKQKLTVSSLKVTKGKYYLCIKDYRDKNCFFEKGKVYVSDKDGFLVDNEDENTFERKVWGDDASEHFCLVLRGELKKPSDELTEFEKAVGVFTGTWNPTTEEQKKSVKAYAAKLMRLARKQIESEKANSV